MILPAEAFNSLIPSVVIILFYKFSLQRINANRNKYFEMFSIHYYPTGDFILNSSTNLFNPSYTWTSMASTKLT